MEFGFDTDIGFGYISDDIDRNYVKIIRFLEKRGFVIYGLSKTACGNSHDESWHTLYHFINDNNPFSEFIEEKQAEKSSLYVNAPTIQFIDEISDEFLNNWSRKYENCSGEETYRILYAKKFDKLYKIKLRKSLPAKSSKSQLEDTNNIQILTALIENI